MTRNITCFQLYEKCVSQSISPPPLFGPYIPVVPFDPDSVIENYYFLIALIRNPSRDERRQYARQTLNRSVDRRLWYELLNCFYASPYDGTVWRSRWLEPVGRRINGAHKIYIRPRDSIITANAHSSTKYCNNYCCVFARHCTQRTTVYTLGVFSV